jgi:uncharacterized protein (DUF58 family)
VLDNHLIFILVLFIIALLVRDDFIFTIVYLLAGVYIFGRIWSTRVLHSLVHERSFTNRAFCGEEIPVKLVVKNRGWLPMVWLRLNESLPVEVAPPTPLRQVLSLGPRQQALFEYSLKGRKRGYYKLGPLYASTGDILGLVGEQRWESSQDSLIVYPRIVRLTSLELPSSSPLGTLKSSQPVYEDPSRVFGKRPYIVGDSLRRVDWKATAATGQMQVKHYDPTISLTTAILLNLNLNEYDRHNWADATELAITVAASIADWVTRKKQNVGLGTNGLDPLSADRQILTIAPGKGQAQLMQILEVLARMQAGETCSLVEVLQDWMGSGLPWGTTLVLISGGADDRLFEELFRCRRSGLNACLVLVGQVSGFRSIKERCHHFGIPLDIIRNELDMDRWRG